MKAESCGVDYYSATSAAILALACESAKIVMSLAAAAGAMSAMQ